MLRKRPPATRDPGGTMALGVENLTQCMNGGATTQLPNSLYSFLPGLCHQNGYNLVSVQHQEGFLNERIGNPYIPSTRRQIRGLILRYIRQRFGCSVWKSADIIMVVNFLDGKLLEEATSMEKYMDLITLIPRLDNLISCYAKGSSAPPTQSVSTGLTGLGTATSLPEAYRTLSTSNGGMLPAVHHADYLSDANGENLPDGQLQWLPDGSCYRQCDTMLDNHPVWNSLPSNATMCTYSGKTTFSDKETLFDNLSQTVGSNSNLTQDNTNFSTLEDCGSTMLLDSFGSYGHLKSHTLPTLHSNRLGDFQESNPTTSHLHHQAGQQSGQKSSAGNQPLAESNVTCVSKMQVVDQQSQNAKVITSDLSTDDLQFTCGTQQIQAQSSPCIQLTSPGNQLSGNSASSIAGYDSSHTSGRFENLEKSLECHVGRAGSFVSCSATSTSTLVYQEIPPKRLKLDPPWTSQVDRHENCRVPHVINTDSLTSPASQEINGDGNVLVSIKEAPELEPRHYSSSSQGSSGTFSEVKSELSGASKKVHVDGLYAISAENSGQFCEDQVQLKADKDTMDLRHNEAGELKKLKLKGVSLIEWFTADQVREHLKTSRHLRDEGVVNNEKCRDLQYPLDENICQICGLSNLSFDPPTIYCSACLNRIGRSRAYYTVVSEALASAGQNYFCNTCYKGSHGGNIQYGKFSIAKSMLEKKKNDDRVPEPWVQCDKCSSWQHQICTLFNYKQNEGERAKYICPSCYLEEMESGERQPLSLDTLLRAKDLPKSKLSEHIEKRLFARLRQEQEERAKMLGKHLSEVPEAKDLVVRVVSSVDRKLEVQKSFFEIFEEQNYPREFMYKSKAILLFQNIEGADVCLFGMYVQEYGSNCPCPNQRHIYLSYIDSVKYFQPDVKAVSGEALRTFVYQEILIAYLDYSKKRGFASCYIWVCPATKREDFIFNCHPEKQKMPKKDKLREWYFVMLEKAAKEDIVVHKTNLYDQFFVSSAECKGSITAARLPYFDGDYWPGIAEKVLDNLREQEEGKEPQKKGKIGISRRDLKAVRHGTSAQKSKDILLMNKLEELILPKKEDFIMLQLRHACNHCFQLIMCGKRWVCNMCRKFQLCDKCHALEQELDVKDRHPIGNAEKHSFQPVDAADMPEATIEEDDNMQSEIFDSRIAFLGLCQGEHYQYDSLRHAKYSTMMILYHLHNATPPTSITSCADCHCDIKAGQGWHCEVCPEYDLCDSCYPREGGDHRHQLISHASDACVKEQNGLSQHRQASLEKNLLNILEHASACSSNACSYPFCRHLKVFFRHSIECRIRLKGGCVRCKKIWSILKLHAQACKQPLCTIPRCMDLRKHFRRLKVLELQSDSRRRAGTWRSQKGDADLVPDKTS